MKKFPLLILPLLAACGQNSLSPAGFDMTATFSGAQVAADVANIYQKNPDGSRGAYLGSSVRKYTVTPGTLNFVVRAGSLGFTVTNATVRYTDAAGSPFATPYNVFNNTQSFKVSEGYVCPGGAAGDTCTFAQKTAQTVSFTPTLPTTYLLSEQAAIVAADSCVDPNVVTESGSGVCAEVRMNIVLTGRDTLGAERTVTIPQAQVRVYVATVTDEVR